MIEWFWLLILPSPFGSKDDNKIAKVWSKASMEPFFKDTLINVEQADGKVSSKCFISSTHRDRASILPGLFIALSPSGEFNRKWCS
jgi:hypothetical protein